LIRPILSKLITKTKKLRYRGRRYFCPLCQSKYRKFLPSGVIPRLNALCPGCGSLERHRLLWLTLEYLWKERKIPKGGYILHVAPEECLERQLKRFFDYLSVDLEPDRAMALMDITDMQFPDGSFEAIVCNHVLEHIPEDRKAIAQLYRVLKPGGWASIQAPIKGEITQEDLSVTQPEARQRFYGQADHVRQYGSDFKFRLQEAGFSVSVFPKAEVMSPVMLKRISVECEREVWICSKKCTA